MQKKEIKKKMKKKLILDPIQTNKKTPKLLTSELNLKPIFIKDTAKLLNEPTY
jgi:hypothetical protein